MLGGGLLPPLPPGKGGVQVEAGGPSCFPGRGGWLPSVTETLVGEVGGGGAPGLVVGPPAGGGGAPLLGAGGPPGRGDP